MILVMAGLCVWFYYTKFHQSEYEYVLLHKRYEQLHAENTRLRSRVRDLQSYKDDVSKTFRILDNEIALINEHLRSEHVQREQEWTDAPAPIEHVEQHEAGHADESQPPLPESANVTLSFTGSTTGYERFLL